VRVYSIDPVRDLRWTRLVSAHANGSVFHSPGWLAALEETYGYAPLAFTFAAPHEELSNGVVFSRVRSPITGGRLVSIPFSDHCQPLVASQGEFCEILSHTIGDREKNRWKYVEIRLLHRGLKPPQGFQATEEFYLHRLDLSPSLDQLFLKLHKDSVQRKIVRSEKESLIFEEGSSDSILNRFYSLMIKTRRRHGLPPQPRCWFQNLAKHLQGKLTIHLASKDDCAVAGILTLRFKDVLVYKYGCSDAQSRRLGSMQALLWRAIQRAKADRVNTFDLGRSNFDDHGLITFKDRWGAERTGLSYYRNPGCATHFGPGGWETKLAKQLFAHLPNRILVACGELLYKHIG
jgi:hypothetical protein